MTIAVEPIGYVRAARAVPEDDHWGGSRAVIELAAGYGPDSLAGLIEFSHVEVIYLFDRVRSDRVVRGARHPRNNPAWPAVGIFAQRGKNRPNRIGTTIVRVLGVTGTRLEVAELDAIDGTPVLDLKPVMTELLPREPVRQPAWSHQLMAAYWAPGT